MKTMIYITITLAICLSIHSCEKGCMDVKYPLYLTNNTSKSIGFYFATGGVGGIYYPDTSLPVSNEYVTYELKSGSTYGYYSGLSWQEIYNDDFPADTLSIYIFSTDTLRAYDWSTIRSQYKVLERWDLSLKDLENKNYRLTYP